MVSGARHKSQRSRRVILKSDCAVLLERILVRFSADESPPASSVRPMTDREKCMIQEMLLRLRPPVGVSVPAVYTAFTKESK